MPIVTHHQREMNDASIDLDLVHRSDRDFMTLVAERTHRFAAHGTVLDFRQLCYRLQQRRVWSVAGGLFAFHKFPSFGSDVRHYQNCTSQSLANLTAFRLRAPPGGGPADFRPSSSPPIPPKRRTTLKKISSKPIGCAQ